jgi:hypothetical protein
MALVMLSNGLEKSLVAYGARDMTDGAMSKQARVNAGL